jgi:hypothetical protein
MRRSEGETRLKRFEVAVNVAEQQYAQVGIICSS